MFRFLVTIPSKRVTQVLLIIGLVIFLTVYTTMLGMFSDMGIESQEFNAIWLSFDVAQFQHFFEGLAENGYLGGFLRTHQLNIVSIAGFMLAFFSMGVLLARKIPESSRLYRTAFLFPVLAIAVAVIDIISSLVVLGNGLDLVQMVGWQVKFLSAAYIGRVLLLYAVIIWIIVAAIIILLRKRSSGPMAGEESPV